MLSFINAERRNPPVILADEGIRRPSWVIAQIATGFKLGKPLHHFPKKWRYFARLEGLEYRSNLNLLPDLLNYACMILESTSS